jgi:hypothetical protein
MTATRARSPRSVGAATASSRAIEVISTSSSPHGTIASYALRSRATFSEKPWNDATQRQEMGFSITESSSSESSR